MTFGTALTVILIGYALYYLGNVIYDLFFKKEARTEVETVEEEEIDISEMLQGEEFAPKDANESERPVFDTSDEEEEGDTLIGNKVLIEDCFKIMSKHFEDEDNSPLDAAGVLYAMEGPDDAEEEIPEEIPEEEP